MKQSLKDKFDRTVIFGEKDLISWASHGQKSIYISALFFSGSTTPPFSSQVTIHINVIYMLCTCKQFPQCFERAEQPISFSFIASNLCSTAQTQTYLFIYGMLIAQSPQGFSKVKISHVEYNIKHANYIQT